MINTVNGKNIFIKSEIAWCLLYESDGKIISFFPSKMAFAIKMNRKKRRRTNYEEELEK